MEEDQMAGTNKEEIRVFLVAILLALFIQSGAAQEKKPGRNKWQIPEWVYKDVNRVPCVLERDPADGLSFRQLLEATTVMQTVKPDGAIEIVDRMNMALLVESEYGEPGRLLIPMDIRFVAARLERSSGGKYFLLDSTIGKTLTKDTRKAFQLMANRVISVKLDKKGEIIDIRGHKKLLPEMLGAVKEEGARFKLRAFLEGILSPTLVENTVRRFHPPIPRGEIKPDQAFYRQAEVEMPLIGKIEIQYQYFYVGMCKVGGRPSAVFWTRLIFPPIEKKKISVGGKKITLSQKKTVVSGLVRVDLKSGHTLTHHLKLRREQEVETNGSILKRVLLQEVRIRTYAPGKKRKDEKGKR